MVDGKIVSTMLDEASANCNFCSATPKQMQDVKSCKKRKLNSAALAFGLSSLHMWMRCAEYLLKISYRMNIKLARIRKNSPEKAKELAEKRRIQTECYNRLGGIRVDFPNPKGGNTNDGNLCRKLLRNYKVIQLIKTPLCSMSHKNQKKLSIVPMRHMSVIRIQNSAKSLSYICF